MPPVGKGKFTFWIDPDQHQALAHIKERDGIPLSEQLRRAIQNWIDAKEGKKGGARKKARR